MNEIENQTEAEVAADVDPIETIYEGECPSLSGRSILSYTIGRHSEDGTLHLRIVNSGKGMTCKDWASASAIQDIILGASELTGKSLQPIWAGRSVNMLSFALAVLRDLGFIRASEVNSRFHEHVPTTTFEQVVMARIGVSSEPTPKPGRRKAKEG